MTRWKASLVTLLLAVAIGGESRLLAVAPQPLGTISCIATAAPVTIRGEGVAELLGDITIHCTNLPAGANFVQYSTVNISVSLAGVHATNNVNFGAGAQIVDAVLVVNGNESASPQASSVLGGGDARFPQPQFGVLAATNRVEWNGVRFPIPGAPNTGTPTGPGAECAHFNNGAGGCFPTTTTFRITSLRANASMLGVPPSGAWPLQVTAFVSMSGELSPPITNNVLNAGLSVLGLVPAMNQAVTGLQCEAVQQTVSVQFAEGSATAFRVEGSANSGPGNTLDEAGYFAPGSNGGDGASNATRLMLRFANIPQGVTIQAPRHIDKGSTAQSGDALELRVVTGSDANGAGGSVGGGEGLQTVALNSQGHGFLLYDVRDANPNAVENIDVPLTISWGGAGNPALGTGQVLPGFAPLTYILQANAIDPEPRFIDTNDARALVTVSACDGTPPPPPPPPPADAPLLTKAAGDNQSVAGGFTLLPLIAQLTQNVIPLPGHILAVSVSGPGSPFLNCPSTVQTNSSGLAYISCTVAHNTTGSAAIALVDVSEGATHLPAPFTVTVLPQAVSLRLLSPATIRLALNSTAQAAIRVVAESQTGPVSNAAVSFSPTEGIQVQPSVARTDSQGIASAAVTIGCIAGPGRVGISLEGGGSSQSVSVEPLPGSFTKIEPVQGGGQSGRPGERLSQALVIEATDDCGSPAQGLDVDWQVRPGGAATLEARLATTNSRGQASTLVRVGSHAGPFTVTATIQGKSVEFPLEAEGGPAALTSASGMSQRVIKGQAAAQPLVARVAGPDGSGYSGVRVNFRVLQGSGQFDPSSVLSDGDGFAATVFTAGSQLGSVVVEAYVIDGDSTQFDLFVTGRKPVVEASAVVDGAAFETGLTAGAAGSIFGVNLMEDINGVMVPAPNAAALSGGGKAQSAGLWPVEFVGVSVRVNGVPAPLFALVNVEGSEQINFQVPFDVAALSQASVEVNNNGAVTTVNNVPILAAKPRLFEIPLEGKVYAAALHLDYSLVGPDRPAHPGEIIQLFLTGLGPTDPPVATNLPGPVPPAATIHQPVVRLDGVEQVVLGSFYAPQLTAVYQVNVRIHEDTAPGEREIEVRIEALAGPRLLLPVGPR